MATLPENETYIMSESHENPGERGELSPDEAARLSERLTDLARSGLPLGPGLRALGEESPRGRFRSSLERLADALDRGVPLAEALEAQKGRIPAHLRGLIEGGLRTGKLGDILGRFSAHANLTAELKRGLWLSLAYPVVSLIVALGLFVLVEVYLVGRFELIYRDFGIPLPAITMVLIGISHVLRGAWPVFVGLFAVLVLAVLFLRFVMRRDKRNRLISRLPILGPLWRYTAWAEFCHLLALLLEAETPMPEALRLAGRGVDHAGIARACDEMALEVERGASLSDALAGRSPDAWAVRRSMPVGLSSLLKWAEDHSTIAEILRMAGEMFQARSGAQATFAGTVLAVLTVIGGMIGVGVVVLALFLPLIQLISKLSG